MKKLWNIVAWLFILAGFPVLLWLGYGTASDTYSLWKYGVERKATVVTLDEVSRSRNSRVFYYQLQVDGERVVWRFPIRLAEGATVVVLAAPDRTKSVALGTRDSSLFAVFVSLVGGRFMAIVVLGVYMFVVAVMPSTFRQVWAQRRELVRG